MSFPTIRLFFLGLAAAAMLLFPGDGLRALGLGEARVDSYLGQRLEMSVRLLSTEADTLEGMTVSLASTADFERLGIPTEALALGLEATIDRRSDPPSIRVTSRNPVRDPVIQILLDARWANGRVLREYTLFLDPPTTPAVAPARRAPAEPPAEPSERADPPAVTETPRRAEPPAEPAPAPRVADEPRVRRDGDIVQVQRGDTLWAIAHDWRPDDSLTMSQVMLAIFELNRHAFMDENINRLASGAELRMPTVDAVRSVGADDAVREVQAHMQAWRQPAADRDLARVFDAGVPEAAPARTPDAPEAPAEVLHRLDVMPAEDDEYAGMGMVDDAEIRQVEEAVAEIEENLFVERLESAEFDQRISEIRDALSTREAAGLAVAEEGLAELESRLREARRARAEAEEGADAVAAYFDDLEREMAEEPMVGELHDETAPGEDVGADPAQEPAPAEVDVADREMPVAATPTAGQRARALWPWLTLGMVVILLAAVTFWLLRRRAAEQVIEAEVADSDSDSDSDSGLDRARKSVDRRPQDLAAHVVLLQALADRGDDRGFSDALDEMYQQVDDEGDARWQEALGLAAAIVPAHPLVESGREISIDESDDDLERRADQLLDMLDDEDFGSTPPESDADDFDAGQDFDEGQAASLADEDAELEDLAAQFDEDVEDEHDDSDWFDTSDDAEKPLSSELVEADEDAADFSELDQPGEPEEQGFEIVPDAAEGLSTEDEQALSDQDESDRQPEKAGDDLDLDFEFTSSADLDLAEDDFGSLLEQEDTAGEVETTSDSGLELDEAQEDRAQSDEDIGLPAEDESAASEKPDGAAELSDEDADVKLDLARAYISVDLPDSARTILEEVVSGGSPEKREEARRLLDDL